MEEQTTQSNEQIETVDLSPTSESSEIISGVEIQDNSFRNPIPFRDSVPTLTIPKTFKEQFCIYKNGLDKDLYVNVDGEWVGTKALSGDISAMVSRRTSSFNITATGYQTIQWDNKVYDTNDMIDLSADNSIITIKTAGKYLINVVLKFSGASTADILLLKNGGSYICGDRKVGTAWLSTSYVGSFSANDTIAIQISPDGSDSIVHGTDASRFSITKL